jgi:fission process protein 1
MRVTADSNSHNSTTPKINRNDLLANHDNKLTENELKESFFNHYINGVLLNKSKYKDFCKDICNKTNNKALTDKLLDDFDFKKLETDVKNLEFQQIKDHLAYHDRIVKKEIVDITDEYRPATYTSRIAIILRKLPAITAKAKAAAYASEVGESFRPIVPRSVVNFLYIVSIGYVIFDIAGRTYCVKDQGKEAMRYFCLDTTLFHLMASLVFPAVVIHKIVKLSQKGMKKALPKSLKLQAWVPAIFALCSVPFIIEPIDHVAEFILDKGVRPFYIDKIAKEAHKLH